MISGGPREYVGGGDTEAWSGGVDGICFSSAVIFLSVSNIVSGQQIDGDTAEVIIVGYVRKDMEWIYKLEIEEIGCVEYG